MGLISCHAPSRPVQDACSLYSPITPIIYDSYDLLPFRLHELRNAVEAVSLLLHTPHLLPPLSPERLSTLTDVLIGCFKAACQATISLSSLSSRKKESGASGTSDAERSKEGESE